LVETLVTVWLRFIAAVGQKVATHQQVKPRRFARRLKFGKSIGQKSQHRVREKINLTLTNPLYCLVKVPKLLSCAFPAPW
jgi:hypothetical protein